MPDLQRDRDQPRRDLSALPEVQRREVGCSRIACQAEGPLVTPAGSPLDVLREVSRCEKHETPERGCPWCFHMEELGVPAALAEVEQLVEAARALAAYGPPPDTIRWNKMDSGHRAALIKARAALARFYRKPAQETKR